MILQCQAQGYKQVQTTPLLGCCQGNKVPYGENMGPTPMGRLGYITINYLSSLSWFLSHLPITDIVRFSSRGMWRLKTETFNYHILDLEFFTQNN